MPTLTVHVTEYHLQEGVRDSCVACPVALAISEALFAAGNKWRLTAVLTDSLTLVRADGPERVLGLPNAVVEVITAIDTNPRSLRPLPFSFDLDAPYQWWGALQSLGAP